MNVKPIETEYKGYRFRSRLEAKWAIFFDAMAIPWLYEPEGYTLDDGTKYLPDFLLPAWDCYAEVKPVIFTETEYWKANHLPKVCLLLDSDPSMRPYYVVGRVDSSYRDYLSGNEYQRMTFEQSVFKKRIWYLLGEPDYIYYSPFMERAVIKARSARFEFGEIPA